MKNLELRKKLEANYAALTVDLERGPCSLWHYGSDDRCSRCDSIADSAFGLKLKIVRKLGVFGGKLGTAARMASVRARYIKRNQSRLAAHRLVGYSGGRRRG